MLSRSVIFAASLVVGCPPAVSQSPCPGNEPTVVVDAARRTLLLCGANGKVEGRYRVSLGRKGLGKREEGDGKTPLGIYRLGKPRPSNSGFYTFIPVAYPTPEQRKAGYTGGAIGVHGPPEDWPEFVVQAGARLGDWTLGCIAVATVKEIQTIAEWVRRTGAQTIHIRHQPG